MEGVIHHSGFSIHSANPSTLIETANGAGLSLNQSQLRLASASTPQLNIGNMIDVRHTNGHTVLDLGHLKGVSLDGYTVPLGEGAVHRVARPERLVVPHATPIANRPSNKYITLDATARAMYMAPKSVAAARAAPKPFMDNARLMVASDRPSGNLQASSTNLQFTPTWSMRTTAEDAFTINHTSKQQPLFMATTDAARIGALNAKNALTSVWDMQVNNTLQAERGISAPLYNNVMGDDVYGIRADSWRAPETVQIGNAFRMTENSVRIGPPVVTSRLSNTKHPSQVIVSNEVQIGPRYKLVDASGNLNLVDVGTNNTVRTLARLIAPPPILLVNTPLELQQLSNFGDERVLIFDLRKWFKPAETGETVAPLRYSLIVNPDNMGTVDGSGDPPELRIRSNHGDVTASPALRTGTVQVRAMSSFGALSPILVIPFEDRYFMPPIPMPPSEPLTLEEGQTVKIDLHKYFSNPNPRPLSNANRTISDVEGRKKWIFRESNKPISAIPEVQASNKNTLYSYEFVAVNEFGQASSPLKIQVREYYVAPPQQVRELPGEISASDDEFAILDLAPFFQDPQRLSLTYRVATNMSNARIEQVGSVLRVRAQNRNITYALQVYAKNGPKEIAARTVVQMREKYIEPPRLIMPATPRLPAEVGDATTTTIDLATYVQDPSQLPLSFSIHSNPNGARAVIDGTKLQVQGRNVNVGPYTIEIAATNGNKRVVFPVQVQEVIWPTPGLAAFAPNAITQ